MTEKPQSRGNKHKKRQQDNKNNKRPKNYLFYHDSSDSEAENGNKNDEGHFGLSNIPNYDEFVKM